MATKKVANKNTKKADTKFDFSDSIKAIKGTAKTVNKEVKEVAEEVVEDIRENGEQLREAAVTTMKNAYNKVSETVNVENITKATKTVNEYTLKTAEELVDGAISNGEKWQNVATKAVKGSLKLAAKQQEIVFDTLETVKGQLTKSALRFKKLFSNN